MKFGFNCSMIGQVAQDNIQNSQQKYKEYYDTRAQEPSFHLGQRVWLHNPNVPKGRSSKLHKKWTGPWYISDIGPNHTFKLRDCHDHKLQRSLVHANRLKHYFSPENRNQYLDHQTQTVTPQETTTSKDKQTSLQTTTSGNKTSIKPVHNKATDVLAPTTDSSSKSLTTEEYTTSQPKEEWGIVDKILACSRHRGKRVYRVKWRDFPKTTWEPEETLPQFLLREFHVTKTLKGKTKKFAK